MSYIDVDNFYFMHIDEDMAVFCDHGVEYRIPIRKLSSMIKAGKHMVCVWTEAQKAADRQKQGVDKPQQH